MEWRGLSEESDLFHFKTFSVILVLFPSVFQKFLLKIKGIWANSFAFILVENIKNQSFVLEFT